MNKKVLFAFSLVTLISLTSCEKASKQKKVDKDTFFEEASKIEKHKYDHTIVNYKERQFKSRYDESSSLTDTEESIVEYDNSYVNIIYDDELSGWSEGKELVDIWYDLEYDPSKNDNKEIDGVIFGDLSPFLNLQNDRLIKDNEMLFLDQAEFYINPFKLVLGFTDGLPGGYIIDYDEYGYPIKIYSKGFAYSGHGDPRPDEGDEDYTIRTTEYAVTEIEIWLEARYE